LSESGGVEMSPGTRQHHRFVRDFTEHFSWF